MASIRPGSMLRQVRTLFSLGRVADRPDGDLLTRFETHHAEAGAAFEELVARHGGMVREVCRRVLRDPNDVEDAFQATFLVLVRRAGSIRNREALGGWLHRVALRVALRARSDAIQRRAVEKTATATSPLHHDADDVEHAERRAMLHEELDRLPASYRAAIVACHLEGLTHEEAAGRLGWPVGTVRSRLARGRDRLRDRLVRRGLGPGVALCALAAHAEAVPASLQRRAVESMLSYGSGTLRAGTVPASVAALTEKVIRAMNFKTLSRFAAIALVVGSVAGILPLWALRTPQPANANAAQKPRPPDPARTLAGIVRDSEGQPVAGATVVAGLFAPQPNHEIATTDADGRFAFPPDADGKRLNYVLAFKEGLAPAGKLQIDKGEVALVLRQAEPFFGSVQDRDGRPIPGADVWIRYMRGPGEQNEQSAILPTVLQETPLERLFHTAADDRGAFRFPAVPSPSRVVINVTAEGMADFSSLVPGDFQAGFISGTEANPARLTMEPGARVVGRVVTKLPGVSVAGLRIGLQSTHGSAMVWRDVVTDAEGRFTMRGLPEAGANLFPYDHPTDGPWTYRAIDSLALHPGKTAEVTIELIEGCLVEGRVVDADSGEPVVGERVGVYGPARPDSGAAILGAKTDAEGRYRFRLPPGRTRFYIASAYRGSETVMIPDDAKTFTVPIIQAQRPEETTRGRELIKPPASKADRPAPSSKDDPQSLTGIVRDVSDRPIGAATVAAAWIRGDRPSPRQTATTGSDGRFTLQPAEGDDAGPILRVFAYRDGFAPAIASVEGPPPDGPLPLVLPPASPFVGVVQDLDEHPIAGAEVRVASLKAPVVEGTGMRVIEVDWPAIEGTPLEAVFRTTSDDQGRFRLTAMPARALLNLNVTADGKRTHRTQDFNLPDMTGRWPAGFDDGFLLGVPDGPAIVYLSPQIERD